MDLALIVILFCGAVLSVFFCIDEVKSFNRWRKLGKPHVSADPEFEAWKKAKIERRPPAG